MSAALRNRADVVPAATGAPGTIAAPVIDKLPPGEGEEYVRRALEDMVIARQRDPLDKAGVSVDELHRDLKVSRQRVSRIISADSPEINLRLGQVLSLRSQPRRMLLAAVLAKADELDGHGPTEDDATLHRRMAAHFGRLSEILDRALADGHVDAVEAAELRAAWAVLAAVAGRGAGR